MTSFRTSRGRCTIDEENLYLSSSWRGQFRRYLEGEAFGKIMILSLLSLPVIMLINFLLQQRPVLEGFAIGLIIGAGLLGLGVLVNYFRGFSYDRKISRESIVKFKAVEGSKGLSQPRFIVKYEKNGEIRNRYIVMPSKFLSYGEEEFEKAREVIREEGFELE